MTYEKAFEIANIGFDGRSTKIRINKFLAIVGDSNQNRDIYYKLVRNLAGKRVVKKHGSFYKAHKKGLLKFQKSDKYKSYRRKYEAGYRDDNRIKVNYNSWKAVTKRTPTQEIDYLLKKML